MSQMDRKSLGEATLNGVRWMTVARIGSETILLLSTVALARMIPPAEFGLAAVALIVSSLATVLTGESFGTPLVQRRDLRDEHARAAFTLSLGFGLVLCAATYATAPLAEDVFGGGTGDLIRLMAPAFLISALGVVPYAMLQRRLDFRRLSTIEILHRVGGTIVAVALALAGMDAEAVLLGALAGAALGTLLTCASARPPLPGFDRRAAREITGFGVPAALSGLLRTANRNIDYAVLVARLGPFQTGLYYRAFQFGVEYQSKISSIMMRIALPVYARAASLDDMRALRARIVRTHATVIFPLLALLIALAPIALPWALGPQWEDSVLPTQILAVAGMTSAVMTGVGPLMLALGRPRALLYWNLCSSIAYGVMVFLVAPLGLTAVCVSVVAMRLVTLCLSQRILMQGIAGIPFRSLFHDAGPATVASAGLLAAAWPLALWAEAAGIPAVPVLALVPLVGAAAYCAVLRVLFGAAWADLLLLIRRVLPSRRRRGAASVARPEPAAASS